MKNILEMKEMVELIRTLTNMYNHGWDERNGGNVSIMLDEDKLKEYLDLTKVIREIPTGFEAKTLEGKYFLVTGTGKYFKNVQYAPEVNLGIIRLVDGGKTAELLWGYTDGGKFTSEFPAHMMSHEVRYAINPKNRVIMHTHPTFTICMGACLPTDEVILTRKLWKSNTEAVVVFPEGVGVLPCMICGTIEIGRATAEKMKEYRLVNWTNHGIYGAGNDLDEAFGLIETVEKTAEIYMRTLDHLVNEIPDEVILGLAKLWNLKMKSGVIDAK